jgi:RNA polymerase sigma factor (sigma-70 family)
MTFDEAYKKFLPAMTRTINRMCMRSRVILDPDDVLQQASLNIWRGWKTHDPSKVKAWVMVVTKNTFFRMVREIRGRTDPRFVEWNAETDHRHKDGSQEWAMILKDVIRSFSALPAHEASAMHMIAKGYDIADVATSLGMNRMYAARVVRDAREKVLSYE